MAIADNLVAGEWYEVPNSQLSALNPCPANNCAYSAVVGFASIMGGWSGGAYDTVQDRLLIWGGGHNDYFGNDVYTFDKAAEAWQQIMPPSNYTATAAMESAGVYPDGRPVARHTYNSLVFIPSQNWFLATGMYAGSPNASTGNSRFFRLDFDTAPLEWSESSEGGAGAIQLGYACHNSVTDKVYYHHESNGQLFEYDPQTDQHTFLATNAIQSYTQPAMDTTRNRMLVLGANSGRRVWLYDFNTPTPTITDLRNDPNFTSGPGAVLADDNSFGFDYDPINDQYVAWRGGADVYFIDADTFAVTQTTGGGASVPGPQLNNGTFGRFRYVPSLGAFILANGIDSNVFFYKVDGSVPGSPDADWLARSTAPGVTFATRFDTQAEVDDHVLQDTSAFKVSWQDAIKASGAGGMRFEILQTATTNHGNWRHPFHRDDYYNNPSDYDLSRSELESGDEIYISWRQYIPAYMATHAFEQTGGQPTGFKQCNIASYNNSNTPFEVVVTSYSRGFPGVYHRGYANPGDSSPSTSNDLGSSEGSFNSGCNSLDRKYQNYIDRSLRPREGVPWPMTGNDPETGQPWTSCDQARARWGGLYSWNANLGNPRGPADPLTGAVIYPQNGGWMAFQVRIKLNSGYTSSSDAANFDNVVEMWACHDGEDWTQTHQRLNINFGPKNVSSGGVVEGFTSFWLLPYTSGGSGSYRDQDTFTVYDEVIASTEFIAAPGFAASVPDTGDTTINATPISLSFEVNAQVSGGEPLAATGKHFYLDTFSIFQNQSFAIRGSSDDGNLPIRIRRYDDQASPNVGGWSEYYNQTITGVGEQALPSDTGGEDWADALNWPVAATINTTGWPAGLYEIHCSAASPEQWWQLSIKPLSPQSDYFVLDNAPTFQMAYNDWGGRSSYTSPRGWYLNMWRPNQTSNITGEMQMLSRFLFEADSNGYQFDHYSMMDLQAGTIPLDQYKCCVIVGHPEYWSLEQRQELERFVDLGGNVAIFGGNCMWWQVRYEGNQQVCFKSDHPSDPDQTATITKKWWEVGRDYDSSLYENTIIGQSTRNGGFCNNISPPVTYPASGGFGGLEVTDASHWVFEGTGLSNGETFGYLNGFGYAASW